MVTKQEAQECVRVCQWLVNASRGDERRNLTLNGIINKAEHALGLTGGKRD